MQESQAKVKIPYEVTRDEARNMPMHDLLAYVNVARMSVSEADQKAVASLQATYRARVAEAEAQTHGKRTAYECELLRYYYDNEASVKAHNMASYTARVQKQQERVKEMQAQAQGVADREAQARVYEAQAWQAREVEEKGVCALCNNGTVTKEDIYCDACYMNIRDEAQFEAQVPCSDEAINTLSRNAQALVIAEVYHEVSSTVLTRYCNDCDCKSIHLASYTLWVCSDCIVNYDEALQAQGKAEVSLYTDLVAEMQEVARKAMREAMARKAREA